MLTSFLQDLLSRTRLLSITTRIKTLTADSTRLLSITPRIKTVGLEMECVLEESY